MSPEIILGLITFGIAIFVVSLLATRIKGRAYVVPFMVFLMVQGVVGLEPLVFAHFAQLELYYIALSGVLWMLIMPCIWLYIEGLTATYRWQLKRAHLLHAVLALFGVIVGVVVLCLPSESQFKIFYADDAQLKAGVEQFSAILVASLFLLWLVQSSLYIYKIFKQLKCYRAGLRQVFTNETHKSLYWINVTLCLLIGSWVWLLMVLFSNFNEKIRFVSDVIPLVLNLVVVWFFSIQALRQRPAFETVYQKLAEEPIDLARSKIKYQRSALGDAQSQRIADKLNNALVSDALYLNNELTLYKLSIHLNIPAHYISQTLNQTMKTSFFEWVNRSRIEAAQVKLSNTNDSVLDIAMAVGFNSRSAFYSAFKQQVGSTPSAYRKRENK
ncbi:helix-turn-helix transcriptional regulator [Pseudoalteromonas sp. MMG013]|uniref:helix-turn-helix domain-containing protein n=1 Tax=Pseudoalteromonas sp. MMG013 TaxID=2822687 RepID=UPI001B362522|nr:AraC family transcriptional regulator [Pseudoalteromonas sp. MMG013]MBQ4864629.1 helix-turn-helix transcriptional regulator [Pseudoalteromonas sp. MMG013]